MSTIRITVNGQEHSIAPSSTLEALLNRLGKDARPDAPIATAVNGRHVAKQARASFVLNDRDEVTTFEPISGG